jgi:hypothetical protein
LDDQKLDGVIGMRFALKIAVGPSNGRVTSRGYNREPDMRSLMGLFLAGGMVIGVSAESKAQFSISIGNPYAGQGIAIGNPGYGYSNGYSSYSGYNNSGYVNNYNGYSNSAYLAGPGSMGYSSGYQGYAPQVVPYTTGYASSGYTNPGVYGYSSGYRGYAPQVYNQGYVTQGYAPQVYSQGYAPQVYTQGFRPVYGGYGNSGYGARNPVQQFLNLGQLFR